MNKKISLVALGFAMVWPLTGQAANGEGEAVVMEEVVVTASRQEENSLTVPANVTVVTAEDIAGTTAQTVPDVLKGLAGIQVADFTGTGRTARVDIRGFGETAGANTLVMVDGRRVNSPDMSGTDWTTIPLNRIDRIEVVRGGGSVLYGNNATGGVINILTKKGTSQPILSAETTFGSYQYFNQAVGASGSSGPLTYNLDGAYTDTDGYRDNGFFRNKTAGTNFSFDQDRYGVNLAAGYKDDRYGLPGSIVEGQPRRSTTSPDDFAETRDEYAQMSPYIVLPTEGELSLALRARRFDSMSNWVRWGGVSEFDMDDYGISPQITQKLNIFNFSHTLVGGLDYQHADLDYKQGFFVGTDRERQDTGAFLHDKIALLDSLYVNLGYRTSRVEYDIDGGASDTFNIDAATAGLTWNYAPGSKLFAAADRAYRTVLLDELGGPAFSEILDPQISKHYQAGISHRFTERLQAGATVFLIDTRDEILFDPEVTLMWGAWFGENLNYGKTRREGVELSLGFDPHEMVRLSANYTFMDHELRGGQYDGNEIPGVARHSATMGVTILPIPELAFDARARWTGDKGMISDWNNVVGDNWDGGDYMVVDAMLTYTWQPVSLFFGINNIFDEEYSENGVYAFDWGTFENYKAIYPSPERNVVGGIRLSKAF